MKEFDVIELLCDMEEDGLMKGQQGTILEIYDDEFCEVEICDKNGSTLFLGALPIRNLKVI